jgi:predicted ATPase
MAKERVRKLSVLTTPAGSSLLDARSALEFSAVQLFVERATDGNGAFQLSDGDATTVGEICRRLDGLALAIELAAARVDTFGVAGLLRQLDDRFRLLSGWRAGPERHRTLGATLDWSYDLLEEREAALLRAVSVFAGAFDLVGAGAVSAASSVEALDALASLSEKSLLAVEPRSDGITCRLLETTRAYSVARLRSSGEEQAVRRRHAEYVCAVLEGAKAEWARRSAREWGTAYGPLVDDLRSAIAWAVSDEANRPLSIRLIIAGTLLWNHLSLTQECRAHVSQALEAVDAAGLAGTATEMQLQMSLAGATMFTRGLVPEVLAALRRTLAIAERIGDVDHRLGSLRMIGAYECFVGECESAVATLEVFASVATQHDPSALPDGETHLGISELHAGRLESARRRLERLHQRASLGFDDARLARFLYDRKVDIGNVLSYAQWLTGSPDSAAHTAEATVAQGLETRHGLSLSNALAVAACPVFFMSRRYEECAHYVAMLDEHVRDHGILIWSPTARFYRGALACAQADPTGRGVDDLEQAVAEFRSINHWARMSWVLAVLADALAASGRLVEAATTIEEAIEWGRAHGERWSMPEVLRIQASILARQGRSDDAEEVLLVAIALARDIGGLSWRLRAAIDLARLWRSRARMNEARELLRPIYASFTEGFATHDLIVAADLIAASSSGKK